MSDEKVAAPGMYARGVGDSAVVSGERLATAEGVLLPVRRSGPGFGVGFALGVATGVVGVVAVSMLVMLQFGQMLAAAVLS